MLKIFQILLLSFISGGLLRGDGVYVGVVEFQSKGITPRNAKILTERFRKELNKTEVFTAIERDVFYKQLKKAGVKKTECITVECLADMGLLTNLDLVVGAHVSMLTDSSYQIVINLVDTDTRIVHKSKTVDVMGELNDVIIQLELLAWNFAWRDPPEFLLMKQRLGASDPKVLAMTKPKTVGGATRRSIFIPGLGSIYRGRPFAGGAFLVSTAACIGLTSSAVGKYSKLQKTRDSKLSKYRDATVGDSIIFYRDELLDIDSDMSNVNKSIITYSGLTAVLWGLSIIHSRYSKPNMDDVLTSRLTRPRMSYDLARRTINLSWSIG